MKKIIEILQYSENTALLTDSQLAIALDKPCFKSNRNYILTEIVYRNILFKKKDLQITDKVCLKLKEKYKDYLNNGIINDVDLNDNDGNIEDILKKKLDFVFKADGFIPVIYQQCPLLLPFKLQKNKSSERISVSDINGNIIESWTKSLKHLKNYIDSAWNIQMNINVMSSIFDLFGGSSLCLPVFISVLRKNGEINFSVLDVLATGCVETGILQKTGGIDGKLKIAEKAGCKIFLYPKETEVGTGIHIADSLEVTVGKIKSILIDKGIMNCDWRYSAEKIKKIDKEIITGILNFNKTLKEIELHSNILNQFNRKQDYIESELLKSTILCHLGETEKAFDINKKTVPAARKIGLIAKAIKAQIRNIVILTDFGDYNSAEFFKSEIEDEIKDLPENNTKNDIMMRYYGTLGQLYLYQGFHESNVNFQNKALDYFNKAVKFANSHIEHYELSREFNYIHLYHVLTDSPYLENAYSNAEKEIFRISDLNIRTLNLSFLYRQKWFGAYRKLLLNNEFTDYADFKVPDKNLNDGWPYTMTMKYKGALLVANENYMEALECFKRGITVLQDKKGLLRILYMTILVQAWNSLKDIPEFSDKTSRFYSDALGISRDKELNSNYKFLNKWKEHLEGKTKLNPQLYFQY